MLRIALVILSLVPIASGGAGIFIGPVALPEPQEMHATADSEYRFTNVFWFAAGIALLWSTFNMRERRVVTRVVLAIAALGGIGRLISILYTGLPHPVFIGALVLEFVVVPLVLWWHARVIPRTKPQPEA